MAGVVKIVYLVLIISVFLTVCGQTFMKIGGSSIDAKDIGIIGLMFEYAKSPYVILGFATSAIAAFLWTYALSKIDFNYASLIASISYIFVMIISIVVFKEKIPPIRWVGCVLIMLGVICVAKS